MRKMIGMIVAWTPVSILAGFILWGISPKLLFVVLAAILAIDILGWVLWFLTLGYTIAEGNKNEN